MWDSHLKNYLMPIMAKINREFCIHPNKLPWTIMNNYTGAASVVGNNRNRGHQFRSY